MPLEARLLTGLALSVAVVYWCTPLAIRVADRFEFYDRPVGYKGHAAPTPYLGGAAVVGGFLLVILLLTGDWQRTLPLAGGVVVLWAVGTIDDRRTVTPRVRVAIEVGLATTLWILGLSWELGFGGVVDLLVCVIWVVAVVNAFNLFDNMDGAASSMACVIAGALAVLGLVNGDAWLSVVAAALCGACAGFLPHNLTSPARIFLGDGGSMPIGFAVAALAMIGVGDAAREWQSLAMGLLFVGIPALDTTLVMISRRRRGLSILTGGQDHLTHRTRERFQTARAVAVALGGAQAVISALAVMAVTGGSAAIVVAVIAYLVGLGVAIVLLDARFAPGTAPAVAVAVTAPHKAVVDWSALLLLLPLAIAIGVSPFFFGYYDAAIWAPAGMGLLGVATAGLIARPPRLELPSTLLLAGIVGAGVWALVSAGWADSIEQAIVEGNRWLAYAALALVLLVLVRSERVALALLAAVGLSCIGVGLTILIRMLGSNPADLFLGGRLDDPLGYINGLGSFFLLGLWLCVAAGERRHALIAALGAGGATLLGGLLLLSQSRGVALAAAVSAFAVLALVPGRVRRGWLLVVVGGAVAWAAPALLDVYRAGSTSAVPFDVGHSAATRLALVTLLGGALWGLAVWAAGRWHGATVRRAGVGVLAAGVAVAVAVGVASADRIANTLDRQYTAFVHLTIEPQGTAVETVPATRLVTGSGNRYDYWQIAWGVWKEAPIRGVGAGNYDRPYFARRTTTESIRQPHSVQLQLLSELGLVGAAIFALALAGIALGARRVIAAGGRRSDPRTIAVASLGVLVGCLVHTSVDWIHLLPGVTAIAIVGAVCLVRRPEGAPERARGTRSRWIPALCVALLVSVAAASLSRQALAGHFVDNARSSLAQDPATALREADRALRLDPEVIGAYYAEAAAYARFNQAGAARATLREAARRDPTDFVTWALLGDLAVRTGDLTDARASYQRAHALNPRDPSLVSLSKDPASAAAGILAP